MTFAVSRSCLFKKHWGSEAGSSPRSYISSQLFPGIQPAFKASSFFARPTFGQHSPLARVGAEAASPTLPASHKAAKIHSENLLGKCRGFHPSREEQGGWGRKERTVQDKLVRPPYSLKHVLRQQQGQPEELLAAGLFISALGAYELLHVLILTETCSFS